VWSPRAGRRDGALGDGLVVANRRQGVASELVGLTEGSGRLRGEVAAWCGGARRGPHRGEGRRRLRLAPGAAGEDERGEGGPK
jgi:hypothetical protein